LDVLYFFVPLSMLVLAGLVWAAFWAIRNNQYEDLEGPAYRILMDDDDPKIPTNASEHTQDDTAELNEEQPAEQSGSRTEK